MRFVVTIFWCFRVFFFKQKTAYEMRISDWSSTCALPICHRARPGHAKRNRRAQDRAARRQQIAPPPVDPEAARKPHAQRRDHGHDQHRAQTEKLEEQVYDPCARSAHPVLGRSAGHGVKGWVGLVIAEQRRGQCKRDQAERRRCRHDAARHEKSPYPLPEGRRVSRAGAAGHRSIPLSFRSAPESLAWASRSEEHTSELQSLMRTSYAVFCL